jgi:hypothetical protein
MRVLRNGNSYVTVVANGRETESVCTVQIPPAVHPGAIWGNEPVLSEQGATFRLGPKSTSVAKWAADAL